MNSHLKYLLNVFVTASLVTLAACSNNLTRANVIGTYEAKRPGGIEHIELKADGSYTYVFKLENGDKLTKSDKWDFDFLGSDPQVAMHNFHPQPVTPAAGEIYLLGAEKHWGRVRLYFSHASDEYYSKTSSP